MKIFYERLVTGNPIWTTPSTVSQFWEIEPDMLEKAKGLATTSTHLFDLVTPDQCQKNNFIAKILELCLLGAIRVIPELCDDEGRELSERIVYKTEKSPEV